MSSINNISPEKLTRLFFMHFWANDDAQKLAKGLGAALANVKVAKN